MDCDGAFVTLAHIVGALILNSSRVVIFQRWCGAHTVHIPHRSQSGTNSCNSIFNVFACCIFVSPIVLLLFRAYSFTCGSENCHVFLFVCVCVCHEDFISSFIITHHKYHYVCVCFIASNASLFIILSSLLYLLHLNSPSLLHPVQIYCIV